MSNKKKSNKQLRKIKRDIYKVLSSHPNQALNYKQIAGELKIFDEERINQIIIILQDLHQREKVEEEHKGKYKLIPEEKYVYGTVDITTRGNAYVICKELEEDVYVPSRNLNKALHSDYVKVYLYKRKKNKKQEGDIVEIIERAKTEFVGVLQMNKNFGFVIPDSSKMYSDIFVSQSKLKEAKDGEKVLVKLTDWPDTSKNPFGEIIEVLGMPGDHDTEIHSILLEYGLPYKFPNEVEEFASKISIEITEKEIAKRKDMRSELTFTIDPKDAKDFDDALSFKVLENGNYEIGIHIADVSHYVDENTILEEEAYNRATSVYLVDRVVPMLPEILSNNVCSLRPNEEKLTFSALFEIDEKAHIIKQWFGRTVTLSDKRFTYEDAQEIIENTSEFKDNNIKKAILKLDELAKIIRKRRMKNGAISFDKTEVKFNLDENLDPIGVYVKESKDAHKLIEEFMLLANKKVAEFIGKSTNLHEKGNKKNKEKTFVYRVHDEPNIDKLTALQGIINKFGYKINTESKKKTSDSLNKLLKDVHGKAESNMVETLTIRSMSKAEYTTQNIGHYGLAFDYYTHFTSPIRRYPDVMVHRLLQHYLDGGNLKIKKFMKRNVSTHPKGKY